MVSNAVGSSYHPFTHYHKGAPPGCNRNRRLGPKLRTRQSKEPNAMHLLRCLALIECSFQFSLVSRHIPGRHNDLADALSRDNLPHFLAHHPQAQPTPTPIPASLYEALISQKPNWTSTAWASQFGNIISRV